jgi:enamine deaminase RidA (YjgF/YER057c/UK114 family)
VSAVSPSDAEARLAQLGVQLPSAPAPAGAYVPIVRTGNLLFTAGQLASAEGRLLATGRLGSEVDVETGKACARQCAVNVLAQLRFELGDLGLVGRFVKVTVFVASDPAFTDQPSVANAASELFTQVFGDDGQHARSAVGVASLPGRRAPARGSARRRGGRRPASRRP